MQDFRHPSVCKDYLLGLCPHALLQNTKEDMGFCQGIHDDKLRVSYQAELVKGHNFGYDRNHERALENFVMNAERKIARSKRRADDGTSIPSIDVDRLPELAEISKTVDDKVKEVEAAVHGGEELRAATLTAELETLRRQRAEMQAKLVRSQPGAVDAPAHVAGNRQRLRVCDICGAFLSLNDSDERLADHFGGRVHLGFLAIRQKLAHMRAQSGAVAPAAHHHHHNSGATGANSAPINAPPPSARGGEGSGGGAPAAAPAAAPSGSGPAPPAQPSHSSSSSSRYPDDRGRAVGGGGGGGYDDRRGGSGYDDRRGGSSYDDRRGGYADRRDDRRDYRGGSDYRGGGGGGGDRDYRRDDSRGGDDRRRDYRESDDRRDAARSGGGARRERSRSRD